VRAVIDWIRDIFARHRDMLAGAGEADPTRTGNMAPADRKSAAD
jgi:hypothetical protein